MDAAALRWAVQEEQARLARATQDALRAARARSATPPPRGSPLGHLAAAIGAADQALLAEEEAAAAALRATEAAERQRAEEARAQREAAEAAEAAKEAEAAARQEAKAQAEAEAARQAEAEQAREEQEAQEREAQREWVSDGAEAWRAECGTALAQARAECAALRAAPLGTRKAYDKPLRKAVNQISSTKQQVLEVYRKLSAMLGQVQRGPREPYAYTLVRLGQLLVGQGDGLQRQHQLAYPVAEIVAALGKDHPGFLPVFLGLLHEKASLTVPLLPKRCSREALKAMAEEHQGYCMLYGALVQAHMVPGSPHGPRHGWAYLARLLNAVPVNYASGSALDGFLQVAGHALCRAYRGQFLKLMLYVKEQVVPGLQADQARDPNKDAAAVTSRLELYIAEQKYAQPPVGSVLVEADSSSALRA